MYGLLTFYLGCFALGLLASLAEFLLGKPFANKFVWYGRPGWLSFSGLLILLTWFGGTGFVFKSLGFPDEISFIMALVCGGAGYGGFVILLGSNSQSGNPNSSTFEGELTGTIAKVSNPIFENSVGQIYFTKGGSHRVIAAKSLSGTLLGLGTQVVIIRLEHGVAYVEDVKQLLSNAGKEKWLSDRPLK